jgi:hypothetical protein
MAVSGRGPDGQEPVLTGSPLASFDVFPQGSNVYYIGTNTSVHQLTNTAGSWAANDILASAAPGSPLTAYALKGSYPRVYYVNGESRIVELAWRTGQWTIQYLPGQPAEDSLLAGPIWLGDLCYLYYVGADRNIYQLEGDQTGDFSERFFAKANVAPGSGLTATNAGDLVMLFYAADADTRLHGLSSFPLVSPHHVFFVDVGDAEPAPGSALTCFTTTDPGDTHVYYLDRQSQINELTIANQTGTPHVLPYEAMPGSALTCYGVNGELPRLYYLDDQAQVNELAWVHGQHGAPAHWTNNPLAYTAARDSALTCYGAEGRWTRLYYLGPDHRVNELAWDDTGQKFVHTGL